MRAKMYFASSFKAEGGGGGELISILLGMYVGPVHEYVGPVHEYALLSSLIIFNRSSYILCRNGVVFVQASKNDNKAFPLLARLQERTRQICTYKIRFV